MKRSARVLPSLPLSMTDEIRHLIADGIVDVTSFAAAA
jgi:hypothetical protein